MDRQKEDPPQYTIAVSGPGVEINDRKLSEAQLRMIIRVIFEA